MKKILVTVIFILAAAVFIQDSLGFALEGQSGIHDPTTVIFCDGKFYTYGTGVVVASSDGIEDCNAIDPGVFLDPNTRRLGETRRAPSHKVWSRLL